MLFPKGKNLRCIVSFIIIIRVMLNSISGALVKHTKKEIKNKINISKITFDAFELLNARNLRHNFYFNILNQCPGGTV
jgi:hypothetical protein